MDVDHGSDRVSTAGTRKPRLRAKLHGTAYGGLAEYASPGLHDAAFALLARHLQPGSSIIDFGSGQGAWALRLSRQGHDVRAFDLVEQESGPIRVEQVDLNGPFSHLGGPEGVDAVTLVEVIEHLENPRHVLREIGAMLRPNGLLLLTTPNASGVYSRVRFFFTGELAMFTDFDYEGSGHITPMTAWSLETVFRDTGFEIAERTFHDARFFPPRSLGDLAKAFSWVALRPLMRGTVGGQVAMVVARRREQG